MEIPNEAFEAANRTVNRYGQAIQARSPASVTVRYDTRLARVAISLSSGLDPAFSLKL